MSVPISPCKILVLGHSYVYWVGAFVRSAGPTSAGLFGDFEVAGRPCELAYEGIRGATVATLLSPTVMSRVVARRADIVVLHIGGSDICGRAASPPIMVALDVLRLARRLLEAGTSHVVVCQVCRRSRWRGLSFEDGAARVIEINRHLEAFCRDSDGVFFWRQKRVWNSVHEVFRADGVHFNDVGNYRFYRSLRGAMMKAVQQVFG